MTKITKKMFKEALEGSLGTNVDLSRRLHVTEGAMTQYFTRNPDMKKLLELKRLDNVDRAENEIFEQLDFNDGEKPEANAKIRQNAAQYITGRLGKNRGWVERQELEHSGDQPHTFNLIVKSEEEIKSDKLDNQPKTA